MSVKSRRAGFLTQAPFMDKKSESQPSFVLSGFNFKNMFLLTSTVHEENKKHELFSLTRRCWLYLIQAFHRLPYQLLKEPPLIPWCIDIDTSQQQQQQQQQQHKEAMIILYYQCRMMSLI